MKKPRTYSLVYLAILVAAVAPHLRAAIPGTTLLETVDILPGPDVYAPQLMALNHTTHKLYVTGSDAPGFQNYGFRVIDTVNNVPAAGIDLGRYASQFGAARFSINGFTVDESSTTGGNRLYALFQSPTNGLPYLRVIDGASDTPLTGEGTDICLCTSDYPYPQVGVSAVVVNPTNHKVYYVDRNGRVAVVDGPNRQVLSTFVSGVGLGPQFMIVNPDANKVFVFGRSGAAIINSSSDSVAPINLGGFVPTGGSYDSANGRVYLIGADANSAARIVALDSNGATVLSVADTSPRGPRGITVDAGSGTIYTGAPSLNLANSGTISAYRASDLAFQNNFSRGAAFLVAESGANGRIYALDYDYSAASGVLRNSVGVFNPADSSFGKIVVGYRPYQLAVNSATKRIYLADEQAPEMVVLDADTHAAVAHVPVPSAQTQSQFPYESTERFVAVSEALNRVYLTGASEDFTTGARTGYVYVYDGTNNQLLQTITVSTVGSGRFLAVDDSNRHLYVAVGVDLLTYDLNNNSFIRRTTMSASCNGLSTNPVNGRVYFSEGSGFRRLQIVDGATGAIVSAVANASEAYRSAVNKANGKVFVVKNANAVSVINGATDSYETGFSNSYQSQFGDNVAALFPDEGTNRVYLLDQANGNGLVGFLVAYDGSNNNYPFLGEVDLGRFPTDIQSCTSNRQIFVSNNQDGTVSVLSLPPATVTARTAEAIVAQHFSYHILRAFFEGTLSGTITYGSVGLPPGFVLDGATGIISGVAPAGSETTSPIAITLQASDGTHTLTTAFQLTISDGVPAFSVNESGAPAANLADTVVRFSARQAGALAGRVMNVQATTTPNNEASWQKLANGTNGSMTYDPAISRYILHSTSYPAVNGVYFRALLSASAHSTLPSNVVGPFNLASNTVRAPQTLFRLKRNGLRADFDFRAIALSPPAGTAVRVQRSTNPSDESSWSDLQNGTSGHMVAEPTNPTGFSLLVNQYPASSGIFFRAICSASGTIDSLSNLIGPYTIVADQPPVVTLMPPMGGTGSGTPEDPIVITVGSNGIANFTVTASATSQRFIKSLSIYFDHSRIAGVKDGATTTGPVLYTTSFIGTHIIEAVALDDLGGTARGGTHPLFVRVSPTGTASAKINVGAEAATAGSGNVFAVVTDGGAWSDPATWIDLHGNHGVPGLDDEAVIGGATVHLPDDVTVKSVFLNGGHVIGPGTLDIFGIITIHGGTFDNCLLDIIQSSAVCEMVNDTDVQFNGPIINFGTWNMHGSGGMRGITKFTNQGTLNWKNPMLKASVLAAGLPPTPRALIASGFENFGGRISATSLIATGGGNVVSDDGASLITNDGGTLITNDGGTLITNDGGTLITNDGGTLITNDGGTLVGNSGGTIISNSTGVLSGSSSNEVVTTPTGFTQNGGETDLNSIEIVGPVAITGGVLSGTGLINGALSLNGGYLAPGHSPGLIAVTGSYTQASGGTLIVETAGGEANQSDQVQVGGNATLGGAVKVRTIGGYDPLPNDPFVPVGASSLSGAFSSSSANVQLTTTPNGVVAVLNPGAPNPTPAALVNIATRMRVESGDNVLIGGFIVTGSVPKRVIIRAIGPSLPVAGALADPILELHAAGGSVITNDDWRATQEAEIIATTVPPSSNLESAIVATLNPGAHTAIVRGKNGGTGVGLVEVYDLEAATASKIVNISTRGRVQTGDDVMIGGIIIQGTEPAKVLIRAIGPSLPVAGALADPILELHDRNGNVIQNDDWRETQETEIIATTVPPTSNAEAALVVTLVPDAYTAVVRGKNGATGVALVEAYTLQN